MTGEGYIVEFQREEMQAVGFVLSLWFAEHVGLNFINAILLADAAASVDIEVMAAHLENVAMKFSEHERRENLGLEEGEFEEVKTRRRARLDQKFAEFKEQGRSLWPVS